MGNSNIGTTRVGLRDAFQETRRIVFAEGAEGKRPDTGGVSEP